MSFAKSGPGTLFSTPTSEVINAAECIHMSDPQWGSLKVSFKILNSLSAFSNHDISHKNANSLAYHIKKCGGDLTKSSPLSIYLR